MFNFTTTPPLALYVHTPWCVRKCPYCDFNSHAVKDGIPEQAYVDALLADLEQDLPSVWGRTLGTVFIGGGTPSLFTPEAIDRLLCGIRARITLDPRAEVTLEANPGTVDSAHFRGFHAAGVNVDKDSGEIVSITGATITSRTVSQSIQKGYKKLTEYIE